MIDDACPVHADAVIILEGDGLDRVKHGINIFKKGLAPNIVFSGGMDNREKGCYNFSNSQHLLSDANIPGNSFFLDDQSMHTRDQAVNIIELSVKQNWTSLILVASQFHQYRAYLTFLKVLQETANDRRILLHSSPVRQQQWFKETGWGKRYDLLRSEFEKIIQYRDDYGHIPEYESFIQYMTWREFQLT